MFAHRVRGGKDQTKRKSKLKQQDLARSSSNGFAMKIQSIQFREKKCLHKRFNHSDNAATRATNGKSYDRWLQKNYLKLELLNMLLFKNIGQFFFLYFEFFTTKNCR